MGNYTILEMFENPRRQASQKFYNKCSQNSRSQIVFRTDIFRKLPLGAPEIFISLKILSYFLVILLQLIKQRICFFAFCELEKFKDYSQT